MAHESAPGEDVSAPVVPPQTHGRHDAYDIYAEIFALRIDDDPSS